MTSAKSMNRSIIILFYFTIILFSFSPSTVAMDELSEICKPMKARTNQSSETVDNQHQTIANEEYQRYVNIFTAPPPIDPSQYHNLEPRFVIQHHMSNIPSSSTTLPKFVQISDNDESRERKGKKKMSETSQHERKSQLSQKLSHATYRKRVESRAQETQAENRRMEERIEQSKNTLRRLYKNLDALSNNYHIYSAGIGGSTSPKGLEFKSKLMTLARDITEKINALELKLNRPENLLKITYNIQAETGAIRLITLNNRFV